MKDFLKVVGFSFFAVVAFAAYSNFGIPQVKPAPPPVEEKIDLGAMTMDTFIALGDKVFNGKGTCTLCHNSLGRAPMLDAVASIAEERMKDPKYAGEAKTPEEYVYESLVKPSAFVVAGFGKAGTNDTVSPMPDVSTGSVGLREVELRAVVAYLQDLAGAEVTVEIPEDTGGDEEEAAPAERQIAKTPEEAIELYGCGMCHKIAGQEGDMGPDLSKIGATKKADYLRRAILDPNADVAAGFDADMMPTDLGDQMSAGELEMLVNYMAGLK